MGIIRTGETQHDKELERWNKPKRAGGMNADGYEHYPLMLYKAFRRENGRVECMENPPPIHLFKEMNDYYRAEAVARAFTSQCQLTVQNDAEYQKARADGWCDSVPLALAHVEALQRDIANAAAEAAASVKRMSDQAKREYADAEAETDAHVADVPAPKKKPGRPKSLVSQ